MRTATNAAAAPLAPVPAVTTPWPPLSWMSATPLRLRRYVATRGWAFSKAARMTACQQAFVAHYLASLNAADAARAGYSTRVADQIGYENLRKPEIAAAIQEGKARQLAAADLSATRVLEELSRLAFSDVGACFDDRGNLLPIQDMPGAVRAAVVTVKLIKRNLTTGDGVVDTIHEVKLWDKLRALEMARETLRADQGARRAPGLARGRGCSQGAPRACQDQGQGVNREHRRPNCRACAAGTITLFYG